MNVRYTQPVAAIALEVAAARTGKTTVIYFRSKAKRGTQITIVSGTSVAIEAGAIEMVREVFRPKARGGQYTNADLRKLGFLPPGTSDTIPARIRAHFGLSDIAK